MKRIRRVRSKQAPRARNRAPRGMSEMWWLIATAVVALLVVILILFWFRGSGGTAFEVINKNIGGLGDKDGDKVADTFDKCPCDPSITDEWPTALQELKKCPIEC